MPMQTTAVPTIGRRTALVLPGTPGWPGRLHPATEPTGPPKGSPEPDKNPPIPPKLPPIETPVTTQIVAQGDSAKARRNRWSNIRSFYALGDLRLNDRMFDSRRIRRIYVMPPGVTTAITTLNEDVAAIKTSLGSGSQYKNDSPKPDDTTNDFGLKTLTTNPIFLVALGVIGYFLFVRKDK